MKRSLKRFASVASIILLISCLFLTNTANAQPLSENKRDEIIDVLSYVDQQKSSFGLEGINFQELEVGNAIKSYEYIDGKFSFMRDYYPLFSEGSLVAFAIDTNNGQFQVETKLSKSVELLDKQCAALIFDRNSCFVWDGESLDKIADFGEIVVGRDSLAMDDDSTFIGVEVVDINSSSSLGYIQKPSSRATAFYLNLGYVTQQPYTDLCWAASIASITNYYHGTSYNAVQIADRYSSGFRGPLSFSAAVSFLRTVSGKAYTAYTSAPSESIIENNMARGHPIFGYFTVSGQSYSHAGTVYGIDTVRNFISVMDPMSGPVTANSSGFFYSYVSYSGSICNLAMAGRVL